MPLIDEKKQSLTHKNYNHYIILLLILIIGISLRIYSITSLSAWVDEFLGGVKAFQPDSFYIQSNSFYDFFIHIKGYQTDQSPVFYLLCFTFFKYFPTLFSDAEQLRYLSLFFSIINLILFYILGRLLFSRRIALFATFLYAISPFHSLFAQLIRPYILLEFACICSLLATFIFIQKPNFIRGIFWLVTSIFVISTHFISTILVLLEILFVAFTYQQENKKYKFAFSMLNFGISLSFILLFFFNTTHAYTKEDDFVMGIPPLPRWTTDLLADDAILTNEPFFFQGQKSSIINNYWMGEIVNIHRWFDTLLVIFFLVATIKVILDLLPEKRMNSTLEPNKSSLFTRFETEFLKKRNQKNNILLFLIAVAIVPVLVLTFISIFRPCLQSRYTLYSSLSLYLLGAYFLCQIDHKKVRYIILSWIVIAYSYQNFIALTSQKTTDFKDAAKTLSKFRKPDEPILSWGTFFFGVPLTSEMFAYHTHLPIEEITPVYSLRDTLTQLEKEFIQNKKESAWLLIEPYVFNFPDETIVETFFSKSDVNLKKYFFPGMNGLWLYHLSKDQNSFQEKVHVPELIDYLPFIERIKKASPQEEVLKKASELLPNYIDFYHPPTALVWIYIAWASLDRNEPIFAEWCARTAISLLPEMSWGYHVLSVSLAEQGKMEEARNTMEICLRKNASPIHQRDYFPIFQSLYVDKNLKQSAEIIKRIENTGGFIHPIYRKRAGLIHD